jgi:hypothetical protein
MNIGSASGVSGAGPQYESRSRLISDRAFHFGELLMRLALLVAGLALAACQKEQATAAPPVAQAPAPQKVEAGGWETTANAHLLLGAKLPTFSAKSNQGQDITNETLRGRWTIIGFESANDGSEEARYVGALHSAVDQDPDLDFLFVYRIPKGALLEIPPPWPSVRDDEWKIAKLLRIDTTPAYVLIGPDLTIQAFHGALSADPDGIKSAIRGVAEIRRKLASPR